MTIQNARSSSQNRSQPFFVSFFFVLGLFFLQFLFLKPFFHTNDDTYELFIVKGVGACLRPDEHVFISNVLIGFLLKALYSSFPHFPWFGWYEIFCEFLAFWALYAAFLLRPGPLFRTLFFFLFFVFTGFYCFLNLNYTWLTALVFQGGLFLLMELLEERTDGLQWKIALLGGFCVWVSSLMRFEVFGFWLLTALPWVAFRLMEKPFPKKRTALIIGLAVGIAGSALFDHWYYQKDSNWGDFVQWSHTVHPIHDWRPIIYSPQTAPVFEKEGWSYNDYLLFKDWYFLDDERYGSEAISRIASHFSRITGSLKGLGSIFRDPTVQNIILAFLTFSLFGSPSSIRRIALLTLWVFFLLLLLVFFAYAPTRIYFPFFCFLASISIFYAKTPFRKEGSKDPAFPKWVIRAGWGFLLFLFLQGFSGLRHFNSESIYRQRSEKDLKMVLEHFPLSNDRLFVVWSFPYEWMGALGSYEEFRNFHIYGLNSLERAPFAKEMLAKFGVRSLFQDMIDNPRIFLVCTPDEIGLYQQYLRERKGPRVKFKALLGTPIFNVYSVQRNREK